MPEPFSITTAALRAAAIGARFAGIDIPGIGSVFGGKKSDRNLPFGTKSYRDFAAAFIPGAVKVSKAGNVIFGQLRDLGFTDETQVFKDFHATQDFSSTSPAHAVQVVNRAAQAQTTAQEFISRFRTENPRNPGVIKLGIAERKATKGADIPRKVDKKQIGRVALRAARSFIRLPQAKTRTGGFVSKGAFDISELEQDVDRIIPSGFISKQPTTQSRALALNSLR